MKTWSKVVLVVAIGLAGSGVGRAVEENQMDTDVGDSIQLFKKTDPKIEHLFQSAYGYAVFPTVTKGAAGIGAAEGRGEVFEQGKLIGRSKLSQVTVGPQLGGQAYSEVVFFETQAALEEFTKEKLEMSAGASAVAAADGASANAKYRQGVLIFTMPKKGLMFEASVGGQKFQFMPVTTQ